MKTTATTALRIDRAALGQRIKIGRGGQGTVFDTPGVRLTLVGQAVYKEYLVEKRAELDAQVLEAMAQFLESLSFGEGKQLIERAAWPVRVVTDQGTVSGFIMPRMPREFHVGIRVPSGTATWATAEFQHLLNKDDFLVKSGIMISDRDRYELLLDLARGLDLLHRHGVAIGDLSPKNVLWSLAPERRTYFIDCDSMRIHGRSALPQVETPSWEIRTISREDLATPESDCYKFGLLALRLFVQDFETRDSRRLPSRIPPAIRSLVKGSLDSEPFKRPRASEWFGGLEAAIKVAATSSPVIPQAASPTALPRRRTAVQHPPTLTRPRRRREQWLPLPSPPGAIAITIAVALGFVLRPTQPVVACSMATLAITGAADYWRTSRFESMGRSILFGLATGAVFLVSALAILQWSARATTASCFGASLYGVEWLAGWTT